MIKAATLGSSGNSILPERSAARGEALARGRLRPRACAALALCLCLAVPAVAAGGGRTRGPAPRALSGFSGPERVSLTRAFGVAARKVQNEASCRALFDGLALGGAVALVLTVYEPATLSSDVALCDRGAVAITDLRGWRTRLCRTFRTHSSRDQAALLIHEALHVAGMSERPIDPDGMTPHEITRWVKRECSL